MTTADNKALADREQTLVDLPASCRDEIEVLRRKLANDQEGWQALCTVMRHLDTREPPTPSAQAGEVYIVTVRDGNWTGTLEEWRKRPQGLSAQANARIATPSALDAEVRAYCDRMAAAARNDFRIAPSAQVSGGGEVAALPAKWRAEAAQGGTAYDAFNAHGDAMESCADELEAALSTLNDGG